MKTSLGFYKISLFMIFNTLLILGQNPNECRVDRTEPLELPVVVCVEYVCVANIGVQSLLTFAITLLLNLINKK